MSTTFIPSTKLPISFRYPISKPSNHPTKKNCVIISTDCNESQTTAGIYEYNIEANESQIIYKYDAEFKLWNHGQYINPSNNTLILYGGLLRRFVVFDLYTKKIQQQNNTNILSKCGWYPQHQYIPSPINQIHILDCDCHHFIFDIKNKETVKLNPNTLLKSHNIKYPKLVYIEAYKNMFVFGSDRNKSIYEYNKNKWCINKLEMPYATNWHDYDILNYNVPGFGNFLIVFYFSKMEIQILDITNMKWHKSKYNIPNDFKGSYKNCYVMKVMTKDARIIPNAHIIDFQRNINVKVNVMGLIPTENKEILSVSSIEM